MLFIFYDKLGEIIREKRKELGYTLRDLEEKSGVSYSQLSKIERGESTPSKESLTNIAYSLNVDKDILLGLGGYMSEDVYAELLENSKNLFSDRKYFDLMSEVKLVIFKNFENIDKLIRDIYIFLYDNKNDEYWKLFLIDNKEVFEHDFNKYFDNMSVEEMLIILDIETSILTSAELDIFTFLKMAKITFTLKNLEGLNERILNSLRETHEVEEQMVLEFIEREIEEYSDFIKIPIYGEIKAGYGMVGEESIIGYQMESKSRVEDGEYFYLLVKGDSMIEDGIIDGCRVLVRKQSTVPNGKIGVCVINGEEATLKRVVYDGDKIILMAANKNILPKTYDISEVLIQGQVKSFVVDI